MPSTQATYDDANLILRLYELRRDEKLRQAREWFAANFTAPTTDDLQRLAPPGSKENTYMRMVVSYWEMAASFVTAGVLNQDLFFQSNGEMLVVWERVRDVIPGIRALTKNPNSFRNLEIVGNAYVKWMQSNGPEAYAGFQAMLRSMPAGEKA
jgi:hypothetical protein